MRRVVIPELLDTDAGTPAEVRGSLLDLRFFNSRFGGISSTTRLIEQVALQTGTRSLSLLEVAAGTGYVAEHTRSRLRRHGIELSTTLLDRSRAHLNGSERSVVADARALPFADASFDLVGSNLFVHHLEPEELVQFVREGLRVCRRAVLINDLIRHPLHLFLVYAGLPLYRSRLTRHDAPASVRRAYTVEEMRAMLAGTGAARLDFSRHYLFRMGVIIWKEHG
ncbi:MAG TPA: methyltransferase domain-containing protein [Terriglobales bacterium]|nr:methyltransferase domain-containing protein [Terriglobales bacterium]